MLPDGAPQNLILLDLAAAKRVGEEVLYLVSDCGPHQHNQHMVKFGQAIVDHGLYSFVVLLYMEQGQSLPGPMRWLLRDGSATYFPRRPQNIPRTRPTKCLVRFPEFSELHHHFAAQAHMANGRLVEYCVDKGQKFAHL